MKFEYSYGVHGYFLRYLGGMIMTLLVISGVFINTLVIWDGNINKDNTSLFIIATLTIIIGVKGAFYFFKYSSSFTKQYVFENDNVLIIGGKEKELECLIKQIVYRRIWGVFEIETENNQKFILMNSRQYVISDFINLKNFLMNKNIASSKWL